MSEFIAIVTFESLAFPGVFLRMNPHGVDKPLPSGGGTVNGQFGAGQLERFRMHVFESSVVITDMTLESDAIPGTFLRLDASGLDNNNPFGGVVNCQFGAGPLEHFIFEGELNHTNVALGAIRGGGFPFNGELNLDATGLTQPVPAGGGKVSLSFNSTSLSAFRMRIES